MAAAAPPKGYNTGGHRHLPSVAADPLSACARALPQCPVCYLGRATCRRRARRGSTATHARRTMPGPQGAPSAPGGPLVHERAAERSGATDDGAPLGRATLRLPNPFLERFTQGLVLPDSLRSLRHRNYRLLWIGNLVSNTGDWMDQIAFNWLVYQLTDSAIYLGLVNLARWLPILVFTLVGGVVADRWERRRLMFSTQAIAMVLALVLAVLDVTGLIHIWMVLAIAAGRGIMMSFNQPAKQGLVSDLVPPHDLRNAIALNSTQFNLTRIIGPAIGGLLIATVGIAGAFFLNAVSFI